MASPRTICGPVGLFSSALLQGSSPRLVFVWIIPLRSLVYNTFRQGVFFVKKKHSIFVYAGLIFLDSIKSRSVAELKITLIGHGVSE